MLQFKLVCTELLIKGPTTRIIIQVECVAERANDNSVASVRAKSVSRVHDPLGEHSKYELVFRGQ